MSGSQYGSNAGTGLLQGMQSYVGQRAAQQEYQLKQLQLQQQQALQPFYLEMIKQQMQPKAAGQQWQPQAAGLTPTAQTRAPLLGGQGASQIPSQPASPDQWLQGWMGPPPSLIPAPTPSQIAEEPIPGIPPMAQFQGFSDAKAAGEIQAQRVAALKQRTEPLTQQFASVANAPDPQGLIQANPLLQREWLALEGQGYPNTPQGMRNAFAFDANRIGGVVGAANVTAGSQEVPRGGPLGSILETNTQSGKTTQVKGEDTLEAVDTGNGHNALLPAPGAAGRPRYSPFAVTNQDAAQLQAQAIADYRQPAPGGMVQRTPQGMDIMRRVMQLNPDYDATQYQTKNRARGAFATGKQGDTVRSLSVSVDHLQTLQQAADALNNNNYPLANSIMNGLAVQLGGSAKPTFDALSEIVGDEVAKSVIGAAGGQGDREAIKKGLSSSAGPAAFSGVAQGYQQLMGGQLEGLRRQYEQATGLHDFDRFTSDLAKQKLATHGGAAPAGLPALPGQTAAPAPGGLPPVPQAGAKPTQASTKPISLDEYLKRRGY
jgi:hypothetical protein